VDPGTKVSRFRDPVGVESTKSAGPGSKCCCLTLNLSVFKVFLRGAVLVTQKSGIKNNHATLYKNRFKNE